MLVLVDIWNQIAEVFEDISLVYITTEPNPDSILFLGYKIKD